MRKQLIDEIVEILIEEKRIEKGLAIDTYNNMEYTDENIILIPKSIFRSLANQSNTKHQLEWASFDEKQISRQEMLRDIPASEAYASTYEAMLVVSQEYEIEQLEEIINNLKATSKQLDNNLVAIFLAKTKSLAESYIKKYLIASTKKDRTGKMIGSTEYTDSCLTTIDDNGNELGFLENKESSATGTRSAIIELFGDDSESELSRWFFNNYKEILTKKQVQFVDGEVEINAQQAYSFRRGIQKRVLKAIETEFGINGANYDRLLKLKNERKILEEVLDAKDFEKALNNRLSGERDYEGVATVVDIALSEYCSLKDTRAYRQFKTKSKEVIKPLRVALFKKLAEVNDAIEEWENFVAEKIVATKEVLNSGVAVRDMKKEYISRLNSEVTTKVDLKTAESAIRLLESIENARYPKNIWFSGIAKERDSRFDGINAERLLAKNIYTPEIVEKMENKEIKSGLIWKVL